MPRAVKDKQMRVSPGFGDFKEVTRTLENLGWLTGYRARWISISSSAFPNIPAESPREFSRFFWVHSKLIQGNKC